MRLRNCSVVLMEYFAMCSVDAILRAVYGEVCETFFWIYHFRSNKNVSFHVTHKTNLVTVFC